MNRGVATPCLPTVVVMNRFSQFALTDAAAFCDFAVYYRHQNCRLGGCARVVLRVRLRNCWCDRGSKILRAGAGSELDPVEGLFGHRARGGLDAVHETLETVSH